MNKLPVILIALISLNYCGYSQSSKINLKGNIVGDENQEVLPFAHIIIDSTGTTSNIYGEFSILVEPGDTVRFSYIGYKKRTYVVPPEINTSDLEIEVVLLKDITYLKSVTISSLPETLDGLKEVILETELKDSEYLEHAKRGLEIATYQYMYMRSFKLTMNDYDNYAMFLKGNEALNPAGGNIKGFLKFLKNRAKGKPLEGTYEHYKYYQKNKSK